MNALLGSNRNHAAIDGDLLGARATQKHLDASKVIVVARLMLKIFESKVGLELVI